MLATIRPDGGTAAAVVYAEVTAGIDPETQQSVEGYDPKGGITRVALEANKLVQPANYNARGQMESRGLFKLTSGASPLMRLTLGYDSGSNNGNIASQTIRVGGTLVAPAFTTTQNYGYDGLNRLITAQEGANWKQTFDHDQ